MPEQPLANEKIVLPLCVIIFFSVLNGIMFNVAVPDIAREYSLTPSAVSWVVTAYILVFALGTVTYGKLADIYPIRKLIVIGLVLLNIGSALGLMANIYPLVVAARVLQASGAGAIPALAMLVAMRYFPAARKGMVLGSIASTVALASAVGPIVGGMVAGTFHWKYLFIPTILSLPMLIPIRAMLPMEDVRPGNFDLPGAFMLMLGVSLILVSMTIGSWWVALVALISLMAFALHIRRTPKPFLGTELFTNIPYLSTAIATFLMIGTVFGMFFMVPILLSDVFELGPRAIGMAMFPGAIAAAIFGRIGGGLSDRIGGRKMVLSGVTVLVIGYLLLSTFSGTSSVAVTFCLIIAYSGFSFLQSALPHTVSTQLPIKQIGIGMGLYNLFFFISGSFSSAVIGRILDKQNVIVCLNPFISSEAAYNYSNVAMLLATMAATGGAIFIYGTRKQKSNVNG
jgi:DHA2 family metal-tetracycline-proton antiporter-like MFS transporter